jgi:hypothetical protein
MPKASCETAWDLPLKANQLRLTVEAPIGRCLALAKASVLRSDEDMSVRVGSICEYHSWHEQAAWLQTCLSAEWGVQACDGGPTPLQPPDIQVSHGSSLWLIEGQERYVAKVLLSEATARQPQFSQVRDQILAHCALAGVPVVQPIPTRSGSPRAHVEGRRIELLAFVSDGMSWGTDDRQLDAVAESIFLLRSALDCVPAAIVEQLRAIPLPVLVEEPDARRARDEALADLLPLARRQRDRWGDLIHEALEALEALPSNMLDRALDREASGDGRGVIHGDLHHEHILLSRDEPPRVMAIIDFDNLRVGPRHLDLAWLADQSARRPSRDVAFRTHAAVRCVKRAVELRLISRARIPDMMPSLIAYAVPIVVDIAKDILIRNLRLPVWQRYLDLLDIGRMLTVDRTMVAHQL